jgi:hypothetical protein
LLKRLRGKTGSKANLPDAAAQCNVSGAPWQRLNFLQTSVFSNQVFYGQEGIKGTRLDNGTRSGVEGSCPKENASR